MFNFSSNTIYDKKFKLSDIFKKIGASKEIKQDAGDIVTLTLKYVLTPKTLNCELTEDIKEVYVFEIETRNKRIPESFIKAFDSDIKLQTLFIIKNDNFECGLTAYKFGSNRGKYFQTNWGEDKKYDLPNGSNVSDLYKYILSKFLEYQPFENETVELYIKRYNQLKKLDFQINATSKAIANESQSRKKFEYNARLKQYKEEKDHLLKEIING